MLGAESSLPKAHLGLLYIAEYARTRGIESLCLCDADQEQVSDEVVLRRLRNANPILIGFTCSQEIMRRVLRVASEIKAHCPEVFIVLGGHQAAFTAPEILNDLSYVDGVVLGEGEIPFTELALRLLAGSRDTINEVPGLMVRSGAATVRPTNAPVADINELPWIGPLQVSHGPHIALITSRGCYGRCSFCSTPNFNLLSEGGTWRTRSPESVADEIYTLVNDFNVQSVHIHDPDFVGLGTKAIARAKSIAELLLQRHVHVPLRFTCQAVSAARAGIDFWNLWREVGLEKVYIGLESGVEEDLRLYHKPSRVSDGLEACRILREAGVVIQSGFIMYNPHSTIVSVRRNLAFLQSVGQASLYKHLGSALRVYPGTKDFTDLSQQGLIRYEKSYLEIAPLYKDQFIGEMVAELQSKACLHERSDRMILDFDFALAGKRTQVDTVIGLRTLSEDVMDVYQSFRSERAELIQTGMEDILENGSKDLVRRVQRLSDQLVSGFEQFCTLLNGYVQNELHRSAINVQDS